MFYFVFYLIIIIIIIIIIQSIINTVPEYPKCNPPTLMYIKHKPDDEFINKTGVKWKSKFSIPNEKIRMELLEKKIPGITGIYINI